jgi:colicin import membrane protein
MTRAIGLEDFHAAREAQARVDEIYSAFGDHAPAPRVLEGEGPLSYRQRAANDLKKHSPDWKDVDVRTLPLPAFEIAERKIHADALREARAPTNIPAGQQVERIERDITGRHITRFFGDPELTWSPFKSPVRRLLSTVADR